MVSCDKWNGCDENAMVKNCACDAGAWIQDKNKGKSAPTKDVKLVEEMDPDETA